MDNYRVLLAQDGSLAPIWLQSLPKRGHALKDCWVHRQSWIEMMLRDSQGSSSPCSCNEVDHIVNTPRKTTPIYPSGGISSTSGVDYTVLRRPDGFARGNYVYKKCWEGDSNSMSTQQSSTMRWAMITIVILSGAWTLFHIIWNLAQQTADDYWGIALLILFVLSLIFAFVQYFQERSSLKE